MLAGRPRLASGALWLLLGLSIVVLGWLVALGKGLLAVGILLLGVFYLGILVRWRLGVYGLLVFLPFAGVVTIALTPWEGLPILNPVLYKDWLFVLPAYLGFAGSVVLRREQRPPLDTLPVVLLLALSVLVIAQMANPGVPNTMVALIGAKVWLFYLPLYVLGAALVTTRRELTVLLRLLVMLAVIPCVVGVAEYLLAQVFGYREVMKAVYGAAAASVTQEFTVREIGEAWIERIPSTFTFPTQFFSFALSMMAPCYALGRIDSSVRWRRFGRWMLAVVVVASLLSGSRAAFVFVPLLLALMYGLDRGFVGLLRAGAYFAGAAATALAVSRVTAVALYEHVTELFGRYAEDTAYGGLMQAITASPFGAGTGTNTGPARYAFDRPEFFTTLENYYGKVVAELGIAGLLLIWGVFALSIWRGLKARKGLEDPALRASAAALVAYLTTMALYSFKGSFIDLDPVNVYFWMFAGVLTKLPYLQDPSAQAAVAESGQAHHR